jgi:arylsulfatase A-like enzyme
MKNTILKQSALTATCLLTFGCNQQTKNQSDNKTSENNEEKPNIVMFFTDDNAFWYWGFGGGPKLSPNIDQIGKDGVECTQFYATASVCTPSRYSLQTGKYAGRCLSEQFLEDFPTSGMYNITWNTFLADSEETTMGEVFHKGGYKTGFVGKWHLGHHDIIKKYGFKPDDDPADPKIDSALKAYQQDMINLIKSKGYDYAASITPGNNDTHPMKALQHHNLEWYAKGAIDFIEQRKKDGEPFFLIINITTHHGPCHRESLQEDLKVTQAGYVDGLEGIMPPRASVFERIKEAGHKVDFKTSGTVWTDDMVKAIIDKVNESKMEENTAVIFTTDHNRFDGKATCYQGGVHIPFIMKYPGVIAPGSKCEERCMIPDLFPTFMDMCNIDMPDIKIDGVNRWPVIKGESPKYKRDTLFFEFGYTRAVLVGNYKYIAFRLPKEKLEDMKTGKVDVAYNFIARKGGYLSAKRYPHYYEPDQLYNIKKDYEEQNNLAYKDEYAEKLEEMKAFLKEYLATFDHPFALNDVDEFYFTDKYKELCEKAKEENALEQYHWYQNECY